MHNYKVGQLFLITKWGSFSWLQSGAAHKITKWAKLQSRA